MPDPEAASGAATVAVEGPCNFDRVADEYEATRYLPATIAERIAGLVTGGLADKEWFLDAGVGTGRIGRALAARHRRLVGADVSAGMLQRFRAAAPTAGATRAGLVLSDLRALPFPGGAFGGILSVHVLHLIPDWVGALRELWRTLRPGGVLTLGVEDWSASPTRRHFLDLASERGLLSRRRSGAYSNDAVAVLRDWSADVSEQRPPSLRWSRRADAAATLDALGRRTYSSLWSIPDEAMAEMLGESRAWALAYYSSEDLSTVVESQEAQMTLFSARKR